MHRRVINSKGMPNLPPLPDATAYAERRTVTMSLSSHVQTVSQSLLRTLHSSQKQDKQNRTRKEGPIYRWGWH